MKLDKLNVGFGFVLLLLIDIYLRQLLLLKHDFNCCNSFATRT